MFTRQASRRRTEYIVACILASEQAECLERLVRKAIREELKELRLGETSFPLKSDEDVQLSELPSSLLHALEEL